jgi:hypothetical protein
MLALIWLIATNVSNGQAPVVAFILSPQVVIGKGASLSRNRTQVSELASLVALVGVRVEEEGQVIRSVICEDRSTKEGISKGDDRG